MRTRNKGRKQEHEGSIGPCLLRAVPGLVPVCSRQCGLFNLRNPDELIAVGLSHCDGLPRCMGSYLRSSGVKRNRTPLRSALLQRHNGSLLLGAGGAIPGSSVASSAAQLSSARIIDFPEPRPDPSAHLLPCSLQDLGPPYLLHTSIIKANKAIYCLRERSATTLFHRAFDVLVTRRGKGRNKQ